MPQNWLFGLTKTPMEIATSRLGGPQKPTQPIVISWFHYWYVDNTTNPYTIFLILLFIFSGCSGGLGIEGAPLMTYTF